MQSPHCIASGTADAGTGTSGLWPPDASVDDKLGALGVAMVRVEAQLELIVERLEYQQVASKDGASNAINSKIGAPRHRASFSQGSFMY